MEVMEDLYEGFTSESSSVGMIPGVASSWTVDASGRQYTFQLRPDANWSNGKSVRANIRADQQWLARMSWRGLCSHATGVIARCR
jgi:ABC-type oligopeptide transport system substrate-binding subunit